MRTVKFILIIASLVIYLIIGVITRLLLGWINPYRLIRVLNRLKFYLMQVFKTIAGLKITVSGKTDILREKGLFIISTHVGYLDGVVMGSLVPGSFTTKEEIRKVPLLGKVVAIGGSIFIDRREKTKIIQYVNEIADRLQHKINMFNFPEGHATDGTKILSFFPSFFDAPLRTKAPIVPITINYEKIDGKPIVHKSDVYCFEGCAVLKHVWNLLKYRRIDITVEVYDRIKTNGHINDRKGRKFVSDMCIQRLSEYKNLPIDYDHPFRKKVTPKEKRASV